jgi:hypothetical protein
MMPAGVGNCVRQLGSGGSAEPPGPTCPQVAAYSLVPHSLRHMGKPAPQPLESFVMQTVPDPRLSRHVRRNDAVLHELAASVEGPAGGEHDPFGSPRSSRSFPTTLSAVVPPHDEAPAITVPRASASFRSMEAAHCTSRPRGASAADRSRRPASQPFAELEALGHRHVVILRHDGVGRVRSGPRRLGDRSRRAQLGRRPGWSARGSRAQRDKRGNCR